MKEWADVGDNRIMGQTFSKLLNFNFYWIKFWKIGEYRHVCIPGKIFCSINFVLFKNFIKEIYEMVGAADFRWNWFLREWRRLALDDFKPQSNSEMGLQAWHKRMHSQRNGPLPEMDDWSCQRQVSTTVTVGYMQQWHDWRMTNDSLRPEFSDPIWNWRWAAQRLRPEAKRNGISPTSVI